MTPAHLHLVLNHLPAIGIVFAGALFVVALLERNAPFQRVALWFLVVSALAAIPVYLTGEMEVLGGLALLGALIFRKAQEVPRVVSAGLVALVVATSGLFAWTGYLGGQIRHTEIRSAALATDAGAQTGGERERDDD